MMREAYAMDTTFLVPLVQAAHAYANTRQHARADSMLRIVLSRPLELSDYYRHLAEALAAGLESDGASSVDALRRAAEAAPGSRAWYNLALALISVDRPREALAALEALDPQRGDMRGWSSYWTQYTHALHLLGEHERELAGARELRRHFPDRRVGIVLEARALGALGRVSELDSLIDASLALPPTTYWSQGAAMVVAGEEMLAHGDEATGVQWLERGVAWLEQHLAVDSTHTGHRYWLGSALYDLQRWEEARPLFESLRRQSPDDLQYRGLSAIVAARRGERDPERILGPAPAHDRGEHTAWRARIAAIRGDPDRAATLLSDAVRHGIGGMAWLHASAHHDLEMMDGARGSLPMSLRPARVASRR